MKEVYKISPREADCTNVSSMLQVSDVTAAVDHYPVRHAKLQACV